MIDTLTEEQEIRLEEVTQEWIKNGYSTDRINREAAKQVIGELYKILELTTPTIKFFQSPKECLIAAKDPKILDNVIMSNWWLYWSAFYSFCEEIGIEFDKNYSELLKLLVKKAKTLHIWFPYEKIVFMSDRPIRISVDIQGNLHNTEQKALEYSDGWGICAIQGIVIPDWVVEHKEQITVEKIFAEKNAEIRRVMIDLFGIDQFFAENKTMKLIHKDQYGELYHAQINGDLIAFGKVLDGTHKNNDGSPKIYILPVDPASRTCREGVAGSYGLKEEDYEPDIRT